MKASISAPLLVFIFANLPAASQAASSANICIERMEDGGSVNIYPLDVMLGETKAASLPTGGVKTCFAVKSLGASIWLRWHAFDWNRPDHGLGNRRIVHSPYVGLALIAEKNAKGAVKIFTVCSRRGQGETPYWHISGDGMGYCPSQTL